MLWKIKYVISWKIKDYLLCIFSGLLLNLSFPNFNLWIFAWCGFVPLFFALKGKSALQAFFLAYLTGIVFWFGNIYWLAHVTLIGLIVLVLYLALYFGIFGLLFTTCDLPRATGELFFLPSLWVLLEYIRAYLFTGFPWSLLGYSQWLNLPVIQIADITGAWGVSFLVMLVNAAVYVVVSGKSLAVSKIKKIIPIFLCLIFTLAYGYFRISNLRLTNDNLRLKLSVIQGNIPQELKWTQEANNYILSRYLDISRKASQDKPDLIIWPEAALPVVLEEEPEYFMQVKGLAAELKTRLLLGAVTKRNDSYYNSAVLLSGQGRVLSRYDKLHLVPFGEYIPLKQVFGFLQTVVPIGEMERGREYTLFAVQAAETRSRFGVLVCFEDLFPELSREFVKKGADFLVNITNDAWYKHTSAPFQHLQASVFRAVENRVYLARAANTGVSGFISPQGKIISLVQDRGGKNIFIRGFATYNIFISKQNPAFYTAYPEVLILGILCFIFYVTVRRAREKRQ